MKLKQPKKKVQGQSVLPIASLWTWRSRICRCGTAPRCTSGRCSPSREPSRRYRMLKDIKWDCTSYKKSFLPFRQEMDCDFKGVSWRLPWNSTIGAHYIKRASNSKSHKRNVTKSKDFFFRKALQRGISLWELLQHLNLLVGTMRCRIYYAF